MRVQYPCVKQDDGRLTFDFNRPDDPRHDPVSCLGYISYVLVCVKIGTSPQIFGEAWAALLAHENSSPGWASPPPPTTSTLRTPSDLASP